MASPADFPKRMRPFSPRSTKVCCVRDRGRNQNKARCPSVKFSKTRCMSGVNRASGPMPAADAGARACS
eukprot:214213-Chlamydomonas_euryale.AAC.1